MEDDDIFFSQKSIALVYVRNYKFNTYRKTRRVSSIVSQMIHYPAALLVIIILKNTKARELQKYIRAHTALKQN